MEKAVAIVQARMGSERCPGKSMERVGGLPTIEIVMRRLAKSSGLSAVVLATSALGRDDVIAKHIASLGFDVFRGSETDLVDRYQRCAEEYVEGPYLVRATGDNVFMDWNEITRVVDFGIDGGWDFVGFTNPVFEERLNDFGGEFIRKAALNDVAKRTTDAHDREHVFPFFYANPNRYKVTRINVHEALHCPVKLDLDYPNDLKLMQDIGSAIDDPVETPATEIVKVAQQIQERNQ